MSCDHTRTVWVDQGIDEWTGEKLPAIREEQSTLVDIDIGRMRCSICGEVKYYTGLWQQFWEKQPHPTEKEETNDN